MLSGLVDEVQKDIMNPLGPQTMPVLGVDEVERLLAQTDEPLSVEPVGVAGPSRSAAGGALHDRAPRAAAPQADGDPQLVRCAASMTR